MISRCTYTGRRSTFFFRVPRFSSHQPLLLSDCRLLPSLPQRFQALHESLKASHAGPKELASRRLSARPLLPYCWPLSYETRPFLCDILPPHHSTLGRQTHSTEAFSQTVTGHNPSKKEVDASTLSEGKPTSPKCHGMSQQRTSDCRDTFWPPRRE